MNKSGRIGVVTVTYNSKPVLDQFLYSIEKQTQDDFLVYVVDNASTDGTLARLNTWGDTRLHVISNPVNLGFAEGTNQGIRAALADHCDHVLFLNNDVEFDIDTFEILTAELEALHCDLLAPKILLEDRMHIWSAGGFFNVFKGYLSSHTGVGELDSGQFDATRRIQNATACCLLVRSTVFDAIGMMDIKYFVYHEDADFMFRAWRAGLTTFYTPRARIFHKVSSLTGGTKSPFSIRYNARGHVYFMLKNLGVVRCLFYLPAWQLRTFVKLFTRSMSFEEFLIRQRAFFEGLSVWAS